RPKAASSPPPQAFNRFVISAERASMNGPSPGGLQKIYKTMADFGNPLPPVAAEGEQGGRDDLLPKGDDHETQHDRKDFGNGRSRRTHSGLGAHCKRRGKSMF